MYQKQFRNEGILGEFVDSTVQFAVLAGVGLRYMQVHHLCKIPCA